MADYRAPLREMRFVLEHVLGAHAHYREIGRDDLASDTVDAILGEAGRFAQSVIAPLNASGDRAGARFEESAVSTPPGFAQAYRTFCEAGWPAISSPASLGGHGLPASIEVFIAELLSGANLAWRTYSGLSAGAIALLTAHATPELQERYGSKLVSGEWLATMCLTEPHSGTDIGLIRTRAHDAGDETYRISGEKIFITGGEHDLTGNIVHLVLARLPDSPAGSRGISLFLVPKFLNGGERNTVACTAIESKMGIRASATCAMSFAEATGWLIGAPHSGLACMFTMMNHARLAVGVQGLGTAEAAFQRSAAYAHERRQGRSLAGAKSGVAAEPIIVHADVRRMLLTQRALVEGCRTLVYFTALQADRVHAHPAPSVRREAAETLGLLTPIVKAFVTEAAVECASLALQVHGGHGYIKELGIEQLLRDARILPIYEGANGVQALDLLGRKVCNDDGRAMHAFIERISREASAEPAPYALQPEAVQFRELLDEWRELTNFVLHRVRADERELGAAAHDYLQFCGYVLLGWCWLAQVRAALRAAQSEGQGSLLEAKVSVARFFFARIAPRTRMHATAARAGAQSVEWIA